jgi:hypothetical protein
MWLLAPLACSDPAPSAPAPHPDLPGHSECLPVGEQMSDEVCLAVVEEDGRVPTVSFNVSGVPSRPDDPRLQDPDFQWLESEIRRCTCSCCHSSEIGGPGSHRWDLAFLPVWIDSASGWSLTVLRGDTEEPDQTLPSSDPERLWDLIELELDRRERATSR